MSYSISFTKPYGADYTDPQYQDRITSDVWFTRLNSGTPMFNYKYYLDYGVVNPTPTQLHDDFWYEAAPNYGGTVGVRWAILSKTGFPDLNAPGINPSLFGVPGDTTNFFSFSQMCVLLRAMIDESSKPVSLVNPNGSNEWLLADSSVADNTIMPYLVGKDLCCYIPATNQYFKLIFSVWGVGPSPSVTYTRTPLFTARAPFYTQVVHQNDNYTDYKITYYTDNSSVVQVYQKNGTTNCYQYVGAINVPFCQSPVPYVPPPPPAPPGPPEPSTEVILPFSTVGSFTWTAPLTTTSIEYLVVGGGGGGGGCYDTGAGGGGGAGLLLSGSVSVIPGNTYNIVVGAGGIAGIGNRTAFPPETSGGTGGNSSFDAVVAAGGSGGYHSRSAPSGDGAGGVAANSGTLTAGGGGNGSGNASSPPSGGGGGGNGGAGGTSVNNTPGPGGVGIASSITGSSVTYGAGGAGGRENTNADGVNGAANTGNGGEGGSSISSDSSNGGAGGSGIVILKFLQ
jgi:hypothetical protein